MGKRDACPTDDRVGMGLAPTLVVALVGVSSPLVGEGWGEGVAAPNAFGACFCSGSAVDKN